MNSDLFDDWDENFLEQAIKIEEHYAAASTAAESSRNTRPPPSAQIRRQPPPPPPLPPRPKQKVASRFRAGRDREPDFSPPRELSQRIVEKRPIATTKTTDDSIHVHPCAFITGPRKDEAIDRNNESHSTIVQQNLTKNIGTQTDSDVTSETEKVSLQHGASSRDYLLAVGTSPENKRSGRYFLSQLFLACPEDLTSLLRLSGATNLYGGPDIRSDQSDAAVKLHQLNTVLVKMSKEMMDLPVLLEKLVGLCMSKNDIVVCRSLRILRVVLGTTFNIQLSSYREDPTICSPSNDAIEENYGNESSWRKNKANGDGLYISLDNCISIVKAMQGIALKSNVEYTRKEALAVVNLIVMETDPFSEREKFGFILCESFSNFLCKETGVDVQKQALQILFLLLNCPNLILNFCNQLQDQSNQAEEPLKGQALHFILKGLSDCILCSGTNILEHKVQRKAVIVIAFIASSGNAGFQVLLKQITPTGANILQLIVQILALEFDSSAAGFDRSRELLSERILVTREALILLNRLASNACYSKVVLGLLTRNSASTSLAINAANKISRRVSECRKQNSTDNIHVIEAETLDLACSIRARVFSFLAKNLS